MSNEVKITISGDDAKLLTVWQRQQKEILKNQKALIAMGEAGEQAGNKIGSSMESAGVKGQAAMQGVMSTLKSATAGFVGIAGVIKGVQLLVDQIKREYEHLRGQQARAGQRQVELAPIQREMFENLGDDKTLTPQMANAKVAEISERTGMSPGDVMKIMSTALSFKERSATAASVLPLVEMSAQMSPESGAAGSANVKSLQAIQKISPTAKAADIQGFLIGAKLASPVVNAENFGAYTAPGIAQLMSLGNSAQEAAAFQGALGQGIGDEEGRVTATSAISFAKQLKEKTAKYKVQGGIFQQLAFLQTDEGRKVKNDLLGPLAKEGKHSKKIGLESEAKAFATLIGFVQGEGRYEEILQGTLQDTPELAGAEKFVKQRQAALENDPLQKNFRMDRILDSAAERAQLTQLGAGRQGIGVGRLQDILVKSGATEGEVETLLEAYKVRTEGTPEGTVAKLAAGAGLIQGPGELQSPERAASQVLKFASQERAAGRRYTTSGGTQVGDPSAEDLEAAKALSRAAEMLADAAQKRRADQVPKAGPAEAQQRQ